MSDMEHHGHDEHGHSLPPELAFLVLIAAFAVGLILAWPWTW